MIVYYYVSSMGLVGVRGLKVLFLGGKLRSQYELAFMYDPIMIITSTSCLVSFFPPLLSIRV